MNNIKLFYKVWNKPLLYNYANFTTTLESYFKLKEGIDDGYEIGSGKAYCFRKGLMDFILDYSAPIKKFNAMGLDCRWIVEHQRFDFCFQHLYELHCRSSRSNSQLLDKLADTCKNIQI